MSEFEDKLSKLLSDPNGLNQVMGVVSSILDKDKKEVGGAEQASEDSFIQAAPVASLSQDKEQSIISSALPSLLGSYFKSASLSGIGKQKLDLIMAIKPFLGGSKQSSIDHAVRLVKAASNAKSAIGAIGGGLKNV